MMYNNVQLLLEKRHDTRENKSYTLFCNNFITSVMGLKETFTFSCWYCYWLWLLANVLSTLHYYTRI